MYSSAQYTIMTCFLVKRKSILLLFFALIIIIVLTGCDKQEMSNQHLEIPDIQKGNQIVFDMDLDSGKMHVTAFYTYGTTDEAAFILNQGFEVLQIIADGNLINVDKIKKARTFTEIDYTVNQYNLPDFQEYVLIEYIGILNATTEIAPYVRERITPDFTLLRWETFFHPLFSNADSLENLINDLERLYNMHITINIPQGYLAAFAHNLVIENVFSDNISFTATGALQYNQIAIAIAKYHFIEKETGYFYFFENPDIESVLSDIELTMNHTLEFMTRHFGKVEFNHKLCVIEIMDGLGNFVISETGTVFTQSSSFSTIREMEQFVHEFIHIGWNPKIDNYMVQRSRFFDEAFTSYFTYRVMEDLLGEDEGALHLQSFRNTRGLPLIAIKDFGVYEYGDLSYTIGALFLYELSKFIGIDHFDAITTEFLETYKNTPVDFDLFHDFYVNRVSEPGVSALFDKWIFTNEYEEYFS
ncbi:MAG: hypothetical protein LBD23_08165 [Oscillospiraceae bacterium]|jgi:uncharacterized lipoprotein YehR (DUF1307 family)|nr:hypothetical protein [Oscillospiraceae bacterium]